MQNISFGYIGNIILNVFIFLLLIAVYSYISKMEDIGCACSEHPNRDFIKHFSSFALMFLLLVMVVPTSLINEQFGDVVGGVYTFIKFLFYIICIIFFYVIIDYTRYLVNEKCKCSEDARREFVMAGSVVEISLLLLILFVIILLPILFNSMSFVSENVHSYEKELSTAMKNPYKSVKSISSKVSKSKLLSSKLSSVMKRSVKK
jgi:hypothetical protein